MAKCTADGANNEGGGRVAVRRPRELPHMMSASEGGRGSWKSGCSRGGKRYKSDTNADMGEGSKNPEICGHHISGTSPRGGARKKKRKKLGNDLLFHYCTDRYK